MNFAEIRARIQALISIEGWSDVSPAPDYAGLAQEGLKLFSWHGEYVVEDGAVTTAAGQAEYPLGKPDWIRFFEATYNSSTPIYPSDENVKRRENLLWRSDGNGQPMWFWSPRPSVLRVHPAPDTDGLLITFRGLRCEQPFVAETDIAHCPDVFHEAICLFGAWHHGKTYATGKDSAKKVAAFRAEALGYVEDLKLYLLEQSGQAFQRQVPRAVPERMSLGTG